MLKSIVIGLLAAHAVHADLAPEEVGIVVAKGSRESAALAKYYAEKRGIPTRNVCLVAFPNGGQKLPNESISSESWESDVRPAIRAWLEKNGRKGTIRCLVTTWGVPIRIEAAPKDRIAPYTTFYKTEFDDRIKALTKLIEQIDELSGKDSTEEGGDDSDPSGPGSSASAGGEESAEGELPSAQAAARSKIDALANQLAVAVDSAQSRVRSGEVGADALPAYAAQLEQMYLEAFGPIGLFEGLIRSLRGNAEPPVETVAQREQLRGRIMGLHEARGWIAQQQLPCLDRDRTELGLVGRTGGLVQSLRWVEEQRAIVQKNETAASFDSELSLVLWPDYERLRWQTNFLNARVTVDSVQKSEPVLMVSRIDGPTLIVAKGLIDNAMKVEEGGLRGKAYFDARGLTEGPSGVAGPDPNAMFDQQILRTGELLREETSLEVTVDNQPELFQPGSCPDAALYCGWYSLADYVDAFDWVPGAVAYHVASAEATTLKKPDSNVWCKRLLESGVCATLGPVAEPYLQAFPPPGDFFPTLASGEFTLVETYYRTKPYNSWMMMLIGDPLYRPFSK